MTQEILNCLRGEKSEEAGESPVAPQALPTEGEADEQCSSLQALPPEGKADEQCSSLRALPPEGEADEQCSSLQEPTSPPSAAPAAPLAQGRQEAGSQAQKRQDMRALREHLAALEAQAAAIPGFDLQDALRNPDFVRLTAPGVGVPLADAWYALHREEAERRRETENRQRLAQAVASAARRPREGGDGSAALIAADYRSLSREEQLRVKKRIFEAGARGEKIYP